MVARLVWDEEVPGSSPGTPTQAGVAQLVRASVFQTEGRGFDPLLPLKNEIDYGGCSSMAERLFVEQKVAGSIPVSHPKNWLCSRDIFEYSYCQTLLVLLRSFNHHFSTPRFCHSVSSKSLFHPPQGRIILESEATIPLFV